MIVSESFKEALERFSVELAAAHEREIAALQSDNSQLKEEYNRLRVAKSKIGAKLGGASSGNSSEMPCLPPEITDQIPTVPSSAGHVVLMQNSFDRQSSSDGSEVAAEIGDYPIMPDELIDLQHSPPSDDGSPDDDDNGKCSVKTVHDRFQVENLEYSIDNDDEVLKHPSTNSQEWFALREVEAADSETPNSSSNECLCSIVIIANTIFIAVAVQRHAEIGYEPEWVPVIELLFCIAFALELCWRAFTEKAKLLRAENRYWTFFDAFVVGCMILEQIFTSHFDSFSVIRVFRLFRIVKLLRAFRLLRALDAFRQGRLFIRAASRSWMTLFWFSLIFSGMAFVIAMIVANAVLEECSGGKNSETVLCHKFGTVRRSWFSVVQTMTGGVDWGNFVDPLWDVDIQAAILYAAFCMLSFTVLLNIVTGIFVKLVWDVARNEGNEIYFFDKLQEQQRRFLKMKDIFFKTDVNQSGTISKDELRHACKDKRMQALLANMELDGYSVESLFDILDVDNSGQLDLKEFAGGSLMWAGRARAVDLQRLTIMVQKLKVNLDSIEKKVGTGGASNNRGQKMLLFKDSSAHSIEGIGELDDAESKTPSRVSRHTRVSSSGGEFEAYPTDMFPSRSMIGRQNSLLAMFYDQKPQKSIKNSEHRAMLLGELIQVGALARSLCSSRPLNDHITGKAIKASDMNLYHFDYYVLSPRTTGGTITLEGLDCRRYTQNDVLQQRGAEGRVIAEGFVAQDVYGTDVEVNLKQGKFQDKSGGSSEVFDGDEQCGTPDKIKCLNSVSFKELLSSTAAKPSWFVSHWWGEPILDFIACTKEHAKCRRLGPQESSYWICAYANRQHELAEAITDDPENTSFRKAMKLSKGALLVLDADATPFQRIWCDYELFGTIADPTKMLDVATRRGKQTCLLTQGLAPNEAFAKKIYREQSFPMVVLSKGLQVKLENGIASYPKDKENILKSIGTDPRNGTFDNELLRQNLDTANKCLRSHLAVAVWPQALAHGVVLDFPCEVSEDTVEPLCLPDILLADVGRTDLQMSFAGINVQDLDVEIMALGLPDGLNRLSLSFESCVNITDRGLAMLANKLQYLHSLTDLHLDFLGCVLLSDGGVSFWASKLPPVIEKMNINFAFCSHVTSKSVEALAQNLPGTIYNLYANFAGTKHPEIYESVRDLQQVNKQGTLAKVRKSMKNWQNSKSGIVSTKIMNVR